MSKAQIVELKNEFLLLSLLLFLFGPLFIPNVIVPVVRPLLFTLVFSSGILLYNDNKKWRIVLIALLGVVLVSETLNYFTENSRGGFIASVAYIVFFLSISFKTYQTIYKAKDVSRSVVVAVFTGFILLCLIATVFFTMIETNQPGSFSNIGDDSQFFLNMTYFSFITCLTIGYGDIVPIANEAKQAVMLVALVGNFYNVFVMGVVVGKFIEGARSKK